MTESDTPKPSPRHTRPARAAAGLVLTLLATAPATAVASSTAPTTRPEGTPATRLVCKKGCRHHSISSALRASRAGDRIRVGPGVYRERVVVRGSAKRFISITGDPLRPDRVIVEGRTGGRARTEGFLIDRADGVRLSGMTVRRQSRDGVLVRDADAVRLRALIARQTGGAGIRLQRATGFTVMAATTAWNAGAGLAVDATPELKAPRAALVTGLRTYGNTVGALLTQARSVTITQSRAWNDGTGIVVAGATGAADGPSEDVTLTQNELFFDSFNVYAGAPFRPLATGTGFPVGVGLLLNGGRRVNVQANRVYGNLLAGIVVTGGPDGLQVTRNNLGNGGGNPNGRDLAYDGSGTASCVDATGVASTVPSSRATFSACPAAQDAPARPDGAAQAEIAGWFLDRAAVAGDPGLAERAWIRAGTQQPIDAVTPLERWTAKSGTP